MTTYKSNNTQSETTATASPKQLRVSAADTPDGFTITYKWIADWRWIVIAFVWVVVEFQLFIIYLAAVRPHRFYVINHPGYLVLALSFAYFAAIPIFNKTTTIISNETISIRRGPIPCPWPGKLTRSIDAVRHVSCVSQKSAIVNGNHIYYVSLIFLGGRQATVFTMINDRDSALSYVSYLQELIYRKQTERGKLPGGERVTISPSPIFPPDRNQRLKVALSLFAIPIFLIAVVAFLEWVGLFFR